ncbi:hypothetical protein NUW54_g12166 [Trametes sanguinea]|uniref:Uncharacterized protein n=1 Tax=Trametes sanguinea TaxID=158606 RepID=A0ACC1N0Z1_9APHY|nr:hypothetical protein NUW54_g12166 [Trametes sanguinea]
MTAFFQSRKEQVLDGPPDAAECENLKCGDIFCHVVEAFNPPKCQLWLRELQDDGCKHWRSVKIGHPHPELRGKYLWLTREKKEPSWVTDGYLKRAQKQGQQTATPKKGGKADIGE